jgi:hypothetical protein
LRRVSTITKFGAPVSEFTAAGGDAGTGRGCGDAATTKLCAANDQRDRPPANARHRFTRNACDGHRHVDAGWRVLWQGGREEVGGRGRNGLPYSINSFAPAMTLGGIELSANGSTRPTADLRPGA